MITLRPVTEKDCNMVWCWANDPEVRAVSFSSDDIPYDAHVKWFNNKLNNPGCVFFIAEEINQKPVGQVRYDLLGNEATISVIVAENYRDQGYGSRIIVRASDWIFETSRVKKIHAYVKLGNHPSLKAFKKAGFKLTEITTVKNQLANHLLLSNEE
jgi:RimJ/RimL family protein N-acetyltransferase